MAKKKKKKQKGITVIDTSTIDDVKARINKESANKAKKWGKLTSINTGLTMGTRKNLNSILSKASKKSTKRADELEELRIKKAEEKKERDQQKKEAEKLRKAG